jgi:thiamine pyrophosphate-dependent acetolactate synthase large subunit-like protein
VLVGEAVGRVLVALGADTVFGVVGSGNFHATNAMVDAGARYVAARHEGGAAMMADGYARVSGRLGVLSVHQGPGLTNATTGITEAAKSRTPLLVLAADTAAAALRSNFRIDQDGLAVAVGAVPRRVRSAETAVEDTLAAVRLARGERRTVVLNLPLDVQAAELPGGLPLPEPGCCPGPRDRSSWPGAGRSGRPRDRRWRRWPSSAARCWRRPPWHAGCSPAPRGRWTSAAASPRRSPPS